MVVPMESPFRLLRAVVMAATALQVKVWPIEQVGVEVTVGVGVKVGGQEPLYIYFTVMKSLLLPLEDWPVTQTSLPFTANALDWSTPRPRVYGTSHNILPLGSYLTVWY